MGFCVKVEHAYQAHSGILGSKRCRFTSAHCCRCILRYKDSICRLVSQAVTDLRRTSPSRRRLGSSRRGGGRQPHNKRPPVRVPELTVYRNYHRSPLYGSFTRLNLGFATPRADGGNLTNDSRATERSTATTFPQFSRNLLLRRLRGIQF